MFAEPLIPGEAHPRCIASIIIPARNEEAILPRTLDALRDQRDIRGDAFAPHTFEIILLLNNCTDASVAVAEQYRAQNPELDLHIAVRTLPPEQAFVGTARRLLMDTAWHRMHQRRNAAILSTDGDTVVAPDWLAHNLAALAAGAEVVGGVIHLFPDELDALRRSDPAIYRAYRRDRELQGLVARLESQLDPDPHDPWPRHLEHFGASLACTPAVYARSGGVPPVRSLEDVAFVDALRRCGARLRHCPQTHIFTSARLDGRAEIGLSGQLRHWRDEAERNLPHHVDSASWIEHRFRTLGQLRRLNESARLPRLNAFPEHWQQRLTALYKDHLPTPQFLEQLDAERLIHELFEPLGQPRHAEITEVLRDLEAAIDRVEVRTLTSVR